MVRNEGLDGRCCDGIGRGGEDAPSPWLFTRFHVLWQAVIDIQLDAHLYVKSSLPINGAMN